MRPKVSVIVPAYNVENYIGICLNSIKEQSLQEIEVIIVNDGSKDKSNEIICSYVNEDQRFFLINQVNKGQGCARNTGLANATGEYILFVDSDDWIDRETCEVLYYVAKKNNLDILIYDYFYVIGENKKKRNCYIDAGTVTGIEFLKTSLEKNVFTLSPCNKLIKKDLLDHHEFRHGYIHEDIEFNYSIFLKANIVSCSKYCFYYYRRFRDDSTTSNLSLKNISDLFAIYDFIEEKYERQNASNEIIKSDAYKLVKYEKLSMESLYKLIDDSIKLEPDSVFIEFLKSNQEFQGLMDFYLKNGSSIKHKIVAVFFRSNPKLYFYIGRFFYPFLKKLGIAA